MTSEYYLSTIYYLILGIYLIPNIKTIKMLKIFLTDSPKTENSPNAEKAIASNKLAPITSSIEKALCLLNS